MRSVLATISALALSCHANLFGISPLLIAEQMSVSVEIDDVVHITMQGPDNTWFGVGFGNTIMDGTYAIIATSDENGTLAVEEWILGPHTRGEPLVNPSLTVLSDSIDDGSIRAISIERPIEHTSYSFPTESTTLDIIASDGQDNTLEYATATRMGVFESTLMELTTEAPTTEPTIEPTLEPTASGQTRSPSFSIAPTLEPTEAPENNNNGNGNGGGDDGYKPGQSTLSPTLTEYSTYILDVAHDQSVSIYVDNTDDETSSQLTIVMTGPSDVYYAVGFGNHVMDGTYAIVADGFGGVTERVLAHHQAGKLLPSSFTATVNEVKDGVRTVAVRREISHSREEYFDFDSFLADCQTGVDLIWARGASEILSTHHERGNGLTMYASHCASSTTQTPEVPSGVGYWSLSVSSVCVIAAFYALCGC